MESSRRIYTRRQWDDFWREWNEKKKKKINQSSNYGESVFVGSPSSNHGCREGVDGKCDSFPFIEAIDDDSGDACAGEIVGEGFGEKTEVIVEEESESSVGYGELKKDKKRRRSDDGDYRETLLMKSSDPHLDNTEKAAMMVHTNTKAMEKENIGNGDVSSEDEVYVEELMKERGDDSCLTTREMLKNGEKNDHYNSIEFLYDSHAISSVNTEKVEQQLEKITERSDVSVSLKEDGWLGKNKKKQKGREKIEIPNEDDDDDVIWIAKEEFVHKLDHQEKIDEHINKSQEKNTKLNSTYGGIAYRLRSCSASKFAMKGGKLRDVKNQLFASDDQESESSPDHQIKKDDNCIRNNVHNGDPAPPEINRWGKEVEDDDVIIWVAKEEVVHKLDHQEKIDKQIKESKEKSIKLNSTHGGIAYRLSSCSPSKFATKGGKFRNVKNQLFASEDQESESSPAQMKKHDNCMQNNVHNGENIPGPSPLKFEFEDEDPAPPEINRCGKEVEDDDVIWIAKEEIVHKPDHQEKIDEKIKNKKLNSTCGGISYRLGSCSPSKFATKGEKLRNVKNQFLAFEDRESKSSPDETKKDDNCMQNNAHNDRKKVKNPKHGKGDLNFKKMLLNSLWGDGDVTKNNMHFGRENASGSLPLKFRFEDEDPAPPKINRQDKEVEGFFVDLQTGLQELKGSLTTQPLREDDDNKSAEIDDDPAVCCEKGKHLLILDEQIGLVCKYCSFVYRERKYIMPSFYGGQAKRSGGRRWMKFYDELDCLIADDVVLDGGAGNHCTSINERGTVWEILPQHTKETLYPHQREGFEFLWRNIGGDIHIENLKKLKCDDGGKGCIISHAPGTGKTRLTIMFLMSFMKLFPASRPIIIAPCSMLLTWEDEFRKWEVDVPFHNMNNASLSGREDCTGLYIPNEPKGIESKRILKLCSWAKGSGILGISYRLFEQLVRLKENQEDDRVRKILLKVPSLVVLDEGHTPRNDGSLLWNALSKLKTPRRIILSGTPFQNNFDELYNTLCLVCPKYLRRKKKWDRLTSSIGKDKNVDVRELMTIIAPLVHVHKGSILSEHLPGLRSTLVYLKPTTLQQKLFSVIPQKKFFEEDNYMTWISVHPSLMKDVPHFSDYRSEVEGLEFDPDAGVKTEFVFALIRLSDLHGEKVIVFSQFLAPMELIKKQLQFVFNWVEGREVLYMDGDIGAKHRQASISTFNDPKSEAKVLLASTRACSEGINLVGASRVVLLDVVWNPSVKRQALSRAYRLGQTKIVHVYHLISSTMEAKKFAWQAKKDFISELVFSTSDGSPSERDVPGSEDKILEAIVQHPKHSRIFDQVVHNPKESDFIDTFDFVE